MDVLTLIRLVTLEDRLRGLAWRTGRWRIKICLSVPIKIRLVQTGELRKIMVLGSLTNLRATYFAPSGKR
jgi:hypothetical protein